jgi:AraC-like DNA-binding protein
LIPLLFRTVYFQDGDLGSIFFYVAILEAFLLRKMECLAAIDEVIMPIVQTLKNPSFSIKDLERYSGYSLRQLERKSNETLGISPKKLHTIFRFDSARRAIWKNPEVDLEHLWYSLRYYDYSHFTKDFQKYLDTSPLQFQQRLINQQKLSSYKDVVFLQDD